jgi:glutamine synthetase
MERAETLRETLSRLRQSEAQLVRFLFCDNGGIVRAIAVHLDELEGRLAAGTSLPLAVQATNALDQVQAVDGLGPAGEVRLVPDPDTLAVLPYAPRSAAMLADILTLDGEPWELCPRGFLKRMIRRALDEGLQLQAAFEPEWSLAIRVDDRFVPIDETLGLSTLGMQTAIVVVDEVVEALGKQGVRVVEYHPERGHGQQELSIRHCPALRAADNQILYRETVRAVAFKHGYFASFAPKPWPEQPANGADLHLSLWDPSGQDNLFFDRAAPSQLGRLGRHFAAGLLAHLPGLVALTCPSYNSYRRLEPGAGGPAYASYGPDNRAAALRLASALRGQEMATVNLELRACDGTANPYLALGAVIAAGLDGVRRALEPPEGQLVLDDPSALSDEERGARGIARLPDSLEGALDALEADPVLVDALGDPLCHAYVAVRRSEHAAYAAQGAPFEHKGHFWKY